MRAYIDSNILIWHLRGNESALKFFRKIRKEGEYDLWTGAIQFAEMVFFMHPEEEENTELFLSNFKITPVDKSIVDAGGRIYRKWGPTHGIDVNDALLAATALLTGGHVFTLNKKHFPMPEVIVKKAW